MDWIKAARIVFALTMVVLGGAGLLAGSFAPIWLPVPKTVPVPEVLIYLTSLVTLASGAGMLVKRAISPAALTLLVLLIVWTVLFKGPPVLREPLVEGVYQSIGENAVLIAAAWALCAEFARRRTFPAGPGGLRAAHALYGLALIAFGLSHFLYMSLTAPLVPAWMRAPVLWADLTGAIYIATGLALVTGFLSRVGALVAAVQITLITMLVWGPMVVAGHMSTFNQQETVLSWALTAAAWVLAASFGRAAWFSPLAFSGFDLRRFARG